MINSTPTIKPKKVELIELFYDLIYVYAISRLSLLIDQGGNDPFIPSFARYLVYCFIILQSWLYLTNYVNRYGNWRWYELLITSINMIAALYMSNTISSEQIATPRAFNISMTVMLICVLILYSIVLIKKEKDTSAAKHSVFIISIVTGLYILAALFSFIMRGPLPMILDLLAVLLGAFLPFIIRKDSDPSIVNFPHLVERLELLTIVTFGDSIVTITEFFDVSHFSLFPTALFAIILLLFTSYVTQVHYLINHYQINKGLRLTFSHYFIVIAINMLTISFKFLIVDNSDHMFIALHTVAALSMFFISMYSNYIYYKPELHFEFKDWLICFSSIIIGTIVLMVFIMPVWGLVAGCLTIILPNLFMLLKKRCQCCNINDKNGENITE